MDPVSVSIGVGLATTLLLTELFGLVAGGMVVPGYLALFLDRPLIVGMTLAAALLTWGIVRLISKYVIVYGRRRTSLMILIGFLIGFGVRTAMASLTTGFALEGWQPDDFAIVGYIVPGLIAIWIERQGVAETFGVVLTASAIVRLLLVAISPELLP